MMPPACSRFGADKSCAAVGGLTWLWVRSLRIISGLLFHESCPHLQLPPVIISEREGHELIERELAVTVERHELRTYGRELETLLHHAGSDAERAAISSIPGPSSMSWKASN